jgi:WXXGXW repeat (2 copies)
VRASNLQHIEEERVNLKQSLLTVSAAVLFATGAAGAQVVVRIGPPPPRPVEVVPAPRHRDWVWVPGYHRWDGRRYVWVRGHYVRPPHRGAVWVAGEWRGERGGQVWHEGYWR